MRPKLTEEDKAAIRASKQSSEALAPRYGVSASRIRQIRRGEACLVEKRKRNRRWRDTNPEKARKASREGFRRWYADPKNSEKARALAAAKSAGLRAAKFGVPCAKGVEIADVYFRAATARTLPCEYCGKDPGPGLREVDHKVPFARGGPHLIENLAISCKACNSAKSTMTSEEFLLAKAA